MRRSVPKSIGQIIDETIPRIKMMEEMKRHRVEALWPDIAGKGIAGYTHGIKMQPDGTLHVYLTSASLKEELGYAVDSLKARINQAVGEDIVTNIAIH